MGVVELFSEVSDPRWRNTRHDLGEVLFIALAAVLCGAENCTDMAEFARKLEGVVAFDGKSLKRCYEKGKSHMPPLMVSAWGAQTRMTLATRLAEGGNE